MLKILLGGSPCTHWSIAQKNNRETTAEGIGWELFENYLIAKEKFKPDYFLYENNKSAAQPIKDQISKELDAPLQYINSALVSAQNRQRFYAHNIPGVEQPKDRGVLLRDILESGVVDKEKSYCLKHQAGNSRDYFKKHHTQIAFEPVVINATLDGKSQAIRATCYKDGIRNLVGNDVDRRTCVAEPIRIGCYPSPDGTLKNSQGMRLYSIDGKSVNLTALGGGMGAKTGLYACPVEPMIIKEATKQGYAEIQPGNCVDMTQPNSNTRRGRSMKDKSNCLMTSNQYYQYCGTTDKLIYEVRNGLITIKDKQYPIKLVDGYYIIRKLTVTECMRLQTVPEWYQMPCSASQNYKMLGNGWTVEVIKHILSHIPNIQNEEIQVLSMYDGMSCGQIALTELGCHISSYHATEIDKYAMQTTMANFPNTVQLGDAFQVRNDNWELKI